MLLSYLLSHHPLGSPPLSPTVSRPASAVLHATKIGTQLDNLKAKTADDALQMFMASDKDNGIILLLLFSYLYIMYRCCEGCTLETRCIYSVF